MGGSVGVSWLPQNYNRTPSRGQKGVRSFLKIATKMGVSTPRNKKVMAGGHDFGVESPQTEEAEGLGSGLSGRGLPGSWEALGSILRATCK